MDPEVVIDPGRCICVLGPQVTAEYLTSNPNGVPAVLSYRGLVESGINRLLELEQFPAEADRQHRQTLLKNAYELEPSFAAHKVVESLKAFDSYEQWLSDCFAPLQHARPSSKSTATTLEWLQGLKAKGLPLAYTHYDSVLDNALNTTPLLLDNEEVVNKWAAGKIPGLLHLHGVASLPGSVKLDCLAYEATVADCPGAKVLKQLCKTRHIVFLGFDDVYFDPCIARFSTTFVGPAHAPSRFPLLVTSSTGPQTCAPSFLTLRVAHKKSLDKIFGINTSLGSNGLFSASHTSLHHDSSHPICISLCYASTSSPLLDMALKQLRTVFPNARFSLSLDGSCPVITISFSRNDLHQLWKEFFLEPLLLMPLRSGLLGMILDDDSITVWLSSKPKIPFAVPNQHHHPMISPIWATPSPITSPAVSKMGSSFQHPHSSLPSSLLPSIPSPLLSSMQHFMTDPSAHVSTLLPSLYAQQSRLHQQPKRMQSDSHIQSTTADTRRPKNGILKVFQHASAPSFPYIKEPLPEMPPAAAPAVVTTVAISGTAAPLGGRGENSSEGRLIAVPSAHTMKTEEALNEHRIEYIDQYQQGKVTTPPTTRAPHSSSSSKRSREGEKVDRNDGDTGKHGSGHGSDPTPPPAKKQMVAAGVEFDKARHKFIAEAREWSQKMERNIGKKVEKRRDTPPSEKGGGGGGGGGVVCKDEQEMFLQRHFANLPPRQNTPPSKAHPSSSSSSDPAPGYPATMTAPLLPLGGWGSSAVSSSDGSVAMAATNVEAVKLASASIPSLFLTPTSMGMLSYVAPTVGGLPGTGTLLCGPAILNSYAALQMMSSAGGKPLLLSDLHSLQNLQNFFALQSSERVKGMEAVAVGQTMGQSAKQLTPRPTMWERYTPPQTVQEAHSPPPPPPPPQSTQDVVQQSRQPRDSASKLPAVPKRRRSNSLPGGLVQLSCPGSESIKEASHSPSPPPPPPPSSINNHVHIESPTTTPSPLPPPLPPPLIQLPRELRQMYDPMLSYTTTPSKQQQQVNDPMLSYTTTPSKQQQQVNDPMLSYTTTPSKQQQQVNDPMLSYTTPPQSSPLGVVQFGFVPNSSFPVPHTTSANHDSVLDSGESRDVQEGNDYRDSSVPSENSTLPPFPAGRGPIQLWQFLLDLLTSPDKDDIIRWTGNGYEFHILQPEEVAKLWGTRKNKPKMNYDKLSRGLRYYYSKGIMDKVPGKKLTFKYTCDVQQYIHMRNSSQVSLTGQTGHTTLLLDEDSFHSDDEP